MDAPSCEKCAFFVVDAEWKADMGDGKCHRLPPAPTGFPRTFKAAWCGEFKEKT